jgi:hypothetical protein
VINFSISFLIVTPAFVFVEVRQRQFEPTLPGAGVA